MRNRNVGINVRVNEKEKKILKRNAKKSGLTLSAYLRKVELKNEFSAKYDEEEIEEKITKIQSDFLDIYNHKDSGDDEDGDNKNMGN